MCSPLDYLYLFIYLSTFGAPGHQTRQPTELVIIIFIIIIIITDPILGRDMRAGQNRSLRNPFSSKVAAEPFLQKK